MGKILSSSYQEIGNSYDDFCLARKEFETKTFLQIANFHVSPFTLWAFMQTSTDPNNDCKKIYALKIDQTIFNNINNWDENLNLETLKNQVIMDGAKLPQEIFEDIKERKIPMAIEHNEHFYFLDSNSLSRICSKTGVSTKLIYQSSYVGSLVLYNALATMQDDVALTIRNVDGYRRVMNVVSERTFFSSAIPLVKEMQKKTGFELVYYSITQYNTCCILEGLAIGGYVPTIRMDFSDTGHGNEKYYFCIRPLESENDLAGIILANFKMSDDFFALKEMATKKIVENEARRDSLDCKKFLKDKNIKHAIGKKRIELLSSLFEKKTYSEAMKQIANLPEMVGPINRSSDYELMEAAGKIFMK